MPARLPTFDIPLEMVFCAESKCEPVANKTMKNDKIIEPQCENDYVMINDLYLLNGIRGKVHKMLIALKLSCWIIIKG